MWKKPAPSLKAVVARPMGPARNRFSCSSRCFASAATAAACCFWSCSALFRSSFSAFSAAFCCCWARRWLSFSGSAGRLNQARPSDDPGGGGGIDDAASEAGAPQWRQNGSSDSFNPAQAEQVNPVVWLMNQFLPASLQAEA
jgi:hypothetical protein